MKNVLLEACTGSIESVLAAKRGGAHRVELCSALSEGGVTPSEGLIRAAVAVGLPVNVLIRPRGGDFVYTDAEKNVMLEDIRMAKKLGANGVVIGALNTKGDVDLKLCKELVTAAEGLEITFHRAFDVCRCPQDALEQIINLGCHRLLTSGQQSSVEKGMPLLRKLVEQSHGKIIILAGGGVTPLNASKIVECTGVQEIHASARGANGETDASIIQRILQ